MEDKLNLIRQIFESPAFRDQTKEEQQVVVNQIISTGEVSAKEVEYLYARMNTSWLEKLPYDLFLRFVLDSGLKGKDVINLCNSSSVLNDYCNRGLELQDGTVVDQYLFMKIFYLMEKLEKIVKILELLIKKLLLIGLMIMVN